jgi:hypothetical protein
MMYVCLQRNNGIFVQARQEHANVLAMLQYWLVNSVICVLKRTCSSMTR